MTRFQKFMIKFFLLLSIICIMVLGYARYIEPFNFHTKDITVKNSFIITSDGPLSAVFFSDTHFNEHFTPAHFTKIVRQINELEPDLVFFGGDLIDDYENYKGNLSDISIKLASIEAKIGKYAVYGNHDYSGKSQYEYPSIMETGGFQVLVNQYVGLDENKISIVGIDDVLIGFGEPSIAGYCREDYFNIVICHEPDVIDQILDYNVDLALSGHTHGRQINIKLLDPFILPPYGKKYIKGMYDFENERGTLLYINSGIGTTKMPLRLGSPPEITHFKIKR